jgi:hypothetical protein
LENDAVSRAADVLREFGVASHAVERMSDAARLQLMYDLVARYAHQTTRSIHLLKPFPGVGERFVGERSRIQLATGSNRGGKTMHVVYKVLLALLGYGEKFGLPAKNGRVIAVGQDWDHVGMVMWRKMTWANQFKVIRDLGTGAWRSVRPNPNKVSEIDPSDLMRMSEWKGAPPFLALNEMEVSWFRKHMDQPRKITIPATGWECTFDSSEGDPIQGTDFDLVWLDEEIKREAWVSEMLMRIVDRNGQLWWSFTPQSSTPQAYEFHKLAESGAGHVREFKFLIADNPYLPEIAKREIYESLRPEERDVRWFGNYAIQSRRVYPEFDPVVRHRFDAFPNGSHEPPGDWMKLFSVDPGFQTCAVIFGAVPPPEHPAYPAVYLYDELYLHSATCATYGEALSEKTVGGQWEIAIVDHRYGRQKQETSGRPLVDHYRDEHRERGISTRMSGDGFVWGSDDVDGRTDAMHALLDGDMLKIHPRCANLIREMGNEYFLPNSPDKRNSRKYGHLVACTEMLAGYFDSAGGIYHRPPAKPVEKAPLSPALKAFRRKKKRQREEAAINKKRG